ncbi:MFS transporter [Kineococcus arenarius]|uniref:MFS transporter n=1 Tax=unclassified Kineococcus TaxID=2621656 RepID=UPI003D7E1FFD
MSPSSGAGAPAVAPRQALPRSLAWALGSGTILQGLNSAIIAVALVPIAQHYGDASAIPWLVSGLYIAAAVGSPTGGRLADLFGPRRVYLVGLAVVLLASLAGPFTPSVGWLVVDRVVLGLGTSLQFPAAMAVIRREAARRDASSVGAIGTVALCGQTTAALAPTVGGLLVVLTGWQGIFWVNVPVVVNCALWVLLRVPADDPAPRRGARAALRALDPPGALLFVVALVSSMLALLSLEHARSAVDLPWWLLAVAVLAGTAFTWRELRAPEPFVDLRLLARHRAVAATCLRGFLTFTSFYCVFYGVPQWLETTRGLDAADAGLLMFPVFAVGVLSTVLATRLGRRVRPRTLLLVGNTAMVAAGAVLLLGVGPDTPLALIAVAGALLGVPNGFNNLGNQLTLHAGAPASSAGGASGLYRTAQYLGASASSVVVAHTLPTTAGAVTGDGGIGHLGSWIAGLGALLLLGHALTRVLALLRRRRLPPPPVPAPPVHRTPQETA